MVDEEVTRKSESDLEQLAGLLSQHYPSDYPGRCICGVFYVGTDQGWPRSLSWSDHAAEVLREAGYVHEDTFPHHSRMRTILLALAAGYGTTVQPRVLDLTMEELRQWGWLVMVQVHGHRRFRIAPGIDASGTLQAPTRLGRIRALARLCSVAGAGGA